MRRRDFMGWLAAGALTASPAAAEEVANQGAGRREARKLRRALRRLEAAPAGAWQAYSAPEHRPAARLLRSTMRTLAVADSVTSLPPAERRVAEMDEVLQESAAEVDYVLQAHLARIASMRPEDAQRYRSALRADPELPRRVVGDIDAIAAEAGLGARERKRLRDTASHLAWRLERQSLDAVLDDTLNQVGRQLAHLEGGSSLGLPSADQARWAEELAHWQVSAEPDPESPAPYDGVWATRGYRMLRLSAAIGFGAGVLLLLGPASEGATVILALFPLTAVVVLLVLGVIFLAIDAAQSA